MHFMSKKTWFLLVAFLLLLPGCGKKSDLLADHGGSEEMCSSCTSVKKNEAQIASTDVTPLGVTPTNSGTYFSKYVSELSKKPLTPYEKIDAYKTADPKAPSVLDKPENKTQFSPINVYRILDKAKSDRRTEQMKALGIQKAS